MRNTVKSSKMFQINIILFASAIFAVCESAAIIDKVNKKCSISDAACVQNLYSIIFQEISDNGIIEIGVPKIDPLAIKDSEVVALGMIKLTIKEGEAKGFKKCYASSFKNDLASQRTVVDFVCDVFTVEGSYKIESTPTLLALIGGINIHGEGKGAVVAEKVHLSFDFAFEVKKLDDGELHILFKPDDSKYDFEVKGKTTFSADNLLVGKQEISAVAVNIANENWEFVTKSFGRLIVDRAMELFYEHAQKFLKTIPAKDMISDDLSSYVKS